MEDKSVTPDVVQAPQPIAARKRSHRRSVTTFALVSIVNVALLVLLWTLLVFSSVNSLLVCWQHELVQPLS